MSTFDAAGDRARVPCCMSHDLSRIVESSTQGFALQRDHEHDRIFMICVNLSKNVDRCKSDVSNPSRRCPKVLQLRRRVWISAIIGYIFLRKYTWASLQHNHPHLQRYTRSVYHIAFQFTQVSMLICEQYASPKNRARPIPCRCIHRYRAE
jgi:hypothetical protein